MKERKLAKNTTYFTGALTIQKLLSFIYFWLISNNLFPNQLGQYVFALSFATLFSIFVDLGLSPVLTRESSKDKKSANKFLKNVIGLKLPLAIIALSAAWLIVNITGKPYEVKLLVYLASFVMLLDSFSLSFFVIFRANHNLKYESIGTIIVQGIIFTLGIIALNTTGQAKHLIMALLAASVFNFIYSGFLLKVKLGFSLKPEWDSKIIKYFIKIIPAFALAGIFVKIYNTIDSVLLSYLVNDEAVAIFAVPAKIVYAFQQVIPAAFAAVIFPAFSYYFTHSKALLSQTFVKAFKYLTIIGLPLSIGLVILSKPIINTLWPSYTQAIPTFVVMSLAIPFIFLAFPTGYLLNACDLQKRTTLNRGIVTILSVILNIILILKYSYFGAGLTFLITNVILIFLDFIWIGKVIEINYLVLLKIVLKSIIATAIMAVFIISIQSHFNFLVLGGLGIIAYFAVLFLIKGLNFTELRFSSK